MHVNDAKVNLWTLSISQFFITMKHDVRNWTNVDKWMELQISYRTGNLETREWKPVRRESFSTEGNWCLPQIRSLLKLKNTSLGETKHTITNTKNQPWLIKIRWEKTSSTTSSVHSIPNEIKHWRITKRFLIIAKMFLDNPCKHRSSKIVSTQRWNQLSHLSEKIVMICSLI